MGLQPDVGAVANLGYHVSDQTIGNVLQRHGLAPAPKRSQNTTWKDFIAAHMAVLAGTDFFTVEVSPSALRETDFAKRLSDPVFESDGGKLLWLMLQLFSEYCQQEACCPLTCESLLLELFAGTARHHALSSTDEPSRWRIMREKIHYDFRESLRVRDLAQAAGIHPVHAARIFRRYSGRTPGEYLQHLRVQAACRMIAENNDPLSAVAAQAGFADQSHMNRTFKRIIGTTPGTFQGQLEAGQRSGTRSAASG